MFYLPFPEINQICLFFYLISGNYLSGPFFSSNPYSFKNIFRSKGPKTLNDFERI